MISSIGGPAGFDSLTQNEAALSSALAHTPKSDKHHTIQIYLCGARKQEYAYIGHVDHSAIHVKLYAGVIGIRAIANIYQKYLKRPSKGGRKETDPIVVLTKKTMGRQVLVNFLRCFYEVNDYYGLKNNNVFSTRETLGEVYGVEARKFVMNNNTSHPTCKR